MKKITCLFFCIVLGISAFAQSTEYVPLPKSLQDVNDKPKSNSNVHIQFGGNFGFGFGGSTLNINIAPQLGILPKIDWLCLGVRGTYEVGFYKGVNGLRATEHVFGGGAFVEGYAWDRLVIRAEYELLSLPYDNKSRFVSHAVLVGPGFKQDLSNWTVYVIALFPAFEKNTAPTPNNEAISIYPIMTLRLGFAYNF